MATELGMVATGLPLASRMLGHAWDKSTAWTTKKSVALDCTPLPFTRSRAKRCGKERYGLAGMVTVNCRLLTNVTSVAGRAVLSSRTVVCASNPEPKICTPARSVVEVSVPSGTLAPGMPPIAPGGGGGVDGVGTRTSVICAGFKELNGLGQDAPPVIMSELPVWLHGPRFTTSIWPLPDMTTSA